MGTKYDVVQCIANEKENPKNCPFRLGFRHPAGGGPNYSDGKDRPCGS